jgi:P-type E1-E2 ATPase
MKEEQTYLEQRLEDVATQVSKYAKLLTFIIVLTQVTFLLVKCLFSEKEIFANKTLLDIGQIAITAVVLLIVAISEGLPLAVSIAMAMSIKNLKEDEITVKNLESVQACAQLNDLFVGKNGTLATADLSV